MGRRLIDADKLIKLIDDDIASLDFMNMAMSRESYDVCLCTLRMVKQYIKALQRVATNTEQFENCGTKHGWWLLNKDRHSCLCSVCGTPYRWSEAETMRYCKMCGARMDGGENG